MAMTPTPEALAKAKAIISEHDDLLSDFPSVRFDLRDAIALALTEQAREIERLTINAALSLFYGGSSDMVRTILIEEIRVRATAEGPAQ